MRLRNKLLLAGVGVLVVLVAAALVWLLWASRDIPPPDFSDLAFPFKSISDEANAHTWFQAAGNAVVWGEREKAVYEQLRGGTADVAAVEAVLATNAPALALLRRGLACTDCQPPLVTNSESIGAIRIQPLLDVARVLSLDQRWSARNSDFTRAMKDCLDLLRFGDLEVRQSTCLIQCLTAQAILGMGIGVSHDLVFSNGLDEASLQRIDEVLLSLDVGRAGMPNAMRGEFLFSSGIVEDFRLGHVPADSPDMQPALRSRWRKGDLPLYLLKPNETRLFFAEGTRQGIRNISLTLKDMRFRDVEAELGLTEKNHLNNLWHGNAVGRVLIAAVYPATDRVVKQRCHMECDRAGLRLAIACQRYERKNGRLPAKLDDLAPEFIEAVPSDPFDGQPLRYSRERRIVWAVGENLKDDGGAKTDSHGGGETAVRRRMLDYVMNLPVSPER